ncbi:retinol dehydrogenase 13-like [Aethina tumida]|uniref:retinol dehydrogenase 13-like n=1 Tax=Aethina tumida TaxID=116153 RepID=UPI0021486077|nr:retinol dehydrogenase 13-like [Aethina tumida]
MPCNKMCNSTARLDGKTAVITGSNTGIGKETAQDFYQRGCRVIMACRNLQKANDAVEDIKSKCKDKTNLGELIVTEVDVSNLQSVRKCAQHLLDTEQRIDLLINNAGVMAIPQSKTVDGFEMQFGTNHLGPFLFTLLLLPRIIRSKPARIVMVSSVAHTGGSIDFNDLMYEKRRYGAIGAYQQSKLANVLFAKELARRLEAAKIDGVTTYSLHPGVIDTELYNSLGDTYSGFVQWTMTTINRFFAKTPLQGAQTTIYCAVDEHCANETGLYYAECAVKRPSRRAQDEETAKKLWECSLKLVGLEDNYDPFK